MSYVLIALFSFWFAELSRIPNELLKLKSFLFKKTFTAFRPFDCPKCLAFWLSAFHYFGLVWMPIIYFGCASLLAIIAANLFNKYIKLF